MNGKAPSRFKFTLKDDYEFNACIIIDIMYLDGKPVLHVVDEATSCQAADRYDRKERMGDATPLLDRRVPRTT